MTRKILLTLTLPLLAACGSGVSGEYGSGDGEDWEPVFTFKGDEVDVSMPFGGVVRGTYEVDDGKVAITLSGQTQVYALKDNGCIDAGLLFGEVCKKP